MHTKHIATIAILSNLFACTDAIVLPGALDSQEQALLSTNLSVYASGDDVTVSFTGLGGSATDWIALARTSDPDTMFRAWQYTGGMTDGELTFVAPNLAPGEYEARVYLDWDGTQSLEVAERSEPFTVQAIIGAVVTPSAQAFAADEPVVINYTGLGGDPNDWIAIAAPGSSNYLFVAWTRTPGTPDGQVTFEHLNPGTYVARAFPKDGFVLSGESDTFTVGLGTASISTARPRYTVTEAITVNYAGFTADPTDWITIVPAGAPANAYNEWHYTDGSASGTMQFAALPAGSYEVRAFFADNFNQIATSPFIVADSATVTTNQESYALGEDVVVSFANTPGYAHDWIGIARAGSPDTSFVDWTYLGGEQAGDRAFTGLLPGDYEARLYVDDSFDVLARVTFTISTAGTVSTDNTSYVTGDVVTVSYAGLPGNATDWIAISLAGSADTSFVAWVYTGGQNEGTAQFSELPAGTYEARSYLRDTMTVAGRSASFTVADPVVEPTIPTP